MTSAYVIVQVDVHDDETYAEYRQLSGPSLEPFGGEFLVRGGEVTVLAGDPPLPRLVVLRFPSREQAEAWYRSDAYGGDALPLRRAAATSNDWLVDGVQ